MTSSIGKATRAIFMASALAGCAQAAGNAPTIQGPPVKDTTNPYGQMCNCYKDHLKATVPSDKIVPIGIGNVSDRTGKVNLDRGTGRYVTQGATDILYDTFHIEGKAASLVERAATQITEWEAQNSAKGLIGGTGPYKTRELVTLDNGKAMTRSDLMGLLSEEHRRKVRTGAIDLHEVTLQDKGGNPMKLGKDGQVYRIKERNTRPAQDGQVHGSKLYVVGSINRLDPTTNSGDIKFRVAGIGPEARGFAMQVGLNLRVVDTRSTVVKYTVDLDKMVIGESYGVGVGRVFGTTLVELGAEGKRVEPLQTVALKGMLQLATVRLLEKIYGVPVPERCRAPVRKLEERKLVQDSKEHAAHSSRKQDTAQVGRGAGAR